MRSEVKRKKNFKKNMGKKLKNHTITKRNYNKNRANTRLTDSSANDMCVCVLFVCDQQQIL